MEQPKIKVIPFQQPSPQEIHAYDPTAPADYRVQESKTVGNMTQPTIKVIPFQQPSPQEFHAYDPMAPADYKVQEPKTVGNMTQDEFLDLLVIGIIKANQVMEQKEELGTPAEKPNHPNFLSNIAGTIGDVAHGVVDIAEGVLRGAIDLITFGQAKRSKDVQ